MLPRKRLDGGARGVTRRSVLRFVVGVGATGLVAACGGGNQGTLSTQVPAATTPQAPPANQTLTGTATPVSSPAASPAAKP